MENTLYHKYVEEINRYATFTDGWDYSSKIKIYSILLV